MRKLTSVIIYLLLGFSLVLLWGQTVQLSAQTTLRHEQVAPKIYELLPDFPLENQYVNRETNTVNENNTLVNRLIIYHEFVKRRPMSFRFDWRLTIADYLGVNETIIAESYPGARTLVINPLEGDKQAIGALNLRQRNQLIAALMSIYKPTTEDNLNPNETSEDSPNQTPQLPQPGDANLLKP